MDHNGLLDRNIGLISRQYSVIFISWNIHITYILYLIYIYLIYTISVSV